MAMSLEHAYNILKDSPQMTQVVGSNNASPFQGVATLAQQYHNQANKKEIPMPMQSVLQQQTQPTTFAKGDKVKSKAKSPDHAIDLQIAKQFGTNIPPKLKSILKAVGDEIPVQLGGGIRDLETIERLLDDGISTVIIGTAAVKNPGFVQDACTAFPGHVMVGLDARDGKVATDGWSKITGHEVIDLAKKFEDWGVEAIIYTDIGRDGMLKGVNIEATTKLAQAIRIPVIASGGLSNNQDIEALCRAEEEGVMGVIAGRSIYAGDLDLAAAQKYADELTLKFAKKII